MRAMIAAAVAATALIACGPDLDESTPATATQSQALLDPGGREPAKLTPEQIFGIRPQEQQARAAFQEAYAHTVCSLGVCK